MIGKDILWAGEKRKPQVRCGLSPDVGWAGMICSVLTAPGVLGEGGTEAKTRPQVGSGGFRKGREAEEEKNKSKDEGTPPGRRRCGQASPVAARGAGVAIWGWRLSQPSPTSCLFPWNLPLSAKGGTSGGKSRRWARALVQEGRLRLNLPGSSPGGHVESQQAVMSWAPTGLTYGVQEE